MSNFGISGQKSVVLVEGSYQANHDVIKVNRDRAIFFFFFIYRPKLAVDVLQFVWQRQHQGRREFQVSSTRLKANAVTSFRHF